MKLTTLPYGCIFRDILCNIAGKKGGDSRVARVASRTAGSRCLRCLRTWRRAPQVILSPFALNLRTALIPHTGRRGSG